MVVHPWSKSVDLQQEEAKVALQKTNPSFPFYHIRSTWVSNELSEGYKLTLPVPCLFNTYIVAIIFSNPVNSDINLSYQFWWKRSFSYK